MLNIHYRPFSHFCKKSKTAILWSWLVSSFILFFIRKFLSFRALFRPAKPMDATATRI